MLPYIAGLGMTEYYARKVPWRRLCLFLVLAILAPVACSSERPQHGQVANVLDFTGSRTRAVWLQDMGDGSDFEAQGDQLRLMGFDSEDERGEFVLLGDIENYARPLITRRGDRVVFSSPSCRKGVYR